MANIAQMINVLQAMILTDKEKMVLTPTYYIYKMYVPFQDATFIPVDFDPGSVHRNSITLPRVDALAAKDATGKLWLEFTTLIQKSRLKSMRRSRHDVRSAKGETLTAPAVDSVNTFTAPNTVVPKPFPLV